MKEMVVCKYNQTLNREDTQTTVEWPESNLILIKITLWAVVEITQVKIMELIPQTEGIINKNRCYALISNG